MTSKEIRRHFLDFFQSKSHYIERSAPIVLKNDPTLLFTNAGMNQFKDLFLDSYEPETLKRKSKKFYFVHGKDDPYCDIEDAKDLCRKVNGTFIEIENGHHLGDSSGYTELPMLLDQLTADHIV